MPPTVLIYDQEESTRETLKLILATSVNLIVVETRAQVLEALKQKAPLHLALIGVRGDDGDFDTGFFEEVRKAAPALTVIAVGDYKSEGPALEAVRQGATGYMIKPFKAEEVMALARKAVQPSLK